MQTHLKDSVGTWDSDSGAFLSDKHQRMAEVLNDYNSYYSLVWVPPKDRSATDTKPYAIVDSSPGTAPYVIRFLSETEMVDPAGVLAWIFDGDLSKNRPIDVLRRIENRENAEALLDLRRKEEEEQDRLELGAFFFSGGRDKKHQIMHNGKKFNRS